MKLALIDPALPSIASTGGVVSPLALTLSWLAWTLSSAPPESQA